MADLKAAPAELPAWWLRIGAEMRAYWPHIEISEATLAAWFVDLHDCHESRVRAAYDLLRRRDGRYPPNGADIRREVFAEVKREGDHRRINALLERQRERAEREETGTTQSEKERVA